MNDSFLEKEEGLSLTPMLDMVFILVIFLMVSIQFSDPVRELQVDLPETDETSFAGEGKGSTVLQIRRDGSLLYDTAPIEIGDSRWEELFGPEFCIKKRILLLVDRSSDFHFFSEVAVDLKKRGCQEISIGMKPEK